MVKQVFILGWIASMFLFSGWVGAQETEQQRIERVLQSFDRSPISIPKIETDIVVNGDLAEADWNRASQVEIAWQHSPVGGVAALHPTTVYLLEDGDYLYVAFIGLDPEPERIRAYLGERDDIFRDDYVGFGIDTTGDGARAFEFFANPLGVQADAIVDRQKGEDFSFDVIFDSAGQLTDTGFVVEFAIPLNQLRFPKKDGPQQWNMFFTRTASRDRRYQNFNYPIDRSNSCFVCQYHPTVGFENAKVGKRFQVVPTITANAQETAEPGVSNSDDRDSDTQFGIDDFRWGITPDLSLNATINPDFSQIEADTAQLSVNTNFALFFPERRPFFLEGRDLFNTPINIVNTRNISDPDYGAKLSGKSNANVYGLLSSRDSTTNIIIPGSQNSFLRNLDQDYSANLLRYRYDLPDSSYLGVVVTDRNGDDYSNTVLSLDSFVQITNEDSVSLQFVDTDTENPDELINDSDLNLQKNIDDSGYLIDYRHNSSNRSWSIKRESYGKDFRVDSGFLTQTDIVKKEGQLNFHWRRPSTALVTQANTGLFGEYTDVNSSGDFLGKEVRAYLNGTFPGQTFVGFNRRHRRDIFNGVSFDSQINELNLQTRALSGLNVFGQIRYGDQIDFANTRLGKQLRLFTDLEYNLTRHLLLGLDYTYARLTIDGDELFTANLADLRLSYQFDLKNKLRLVFIRSRIKRDPTLYIDPVDRENISQDIQLLYSYKVNPRTVFFAGFSTSGIDDDDLDGLSNTNKTAFIKWSYAWNL